MQQLPDLLASGTCGLSLPEGAISFPLGLLGFESVKRYELQASTKDFPLPRLQMLEGRKEFFWVVPPGLVVVDYRPDISNEDAGFLGLKEADDALVLNIVTCRQTGATVNLKAPIVINRHTLVGKQVLPTNSPKFDLLHPMRNLALGERNLKQGGKPASVEVKAISEARSSGGGKTAELRESVRTVAFSCVLEQEPFAVAQCFIWVNCLLRPQRVPPENIFIHHTGLFNADFRAWLKAQRVNLVQIQAFDPRSPHCNKIQQIETFLNGKFERVALMDCDTAWIGDADLPDSGPVAAKLADNSKPSEAALAEIFREAKMGDPYWVPVTAPGQGAGLERTDRNICNGGLCLLSASVIPGLNAAWRKWAAWCLDHRQMFGEHPASVDQVSFALAARELGITVQHLPPAWNYSTAWQLKPELDVTPHLLHFHKHLGADYHVKPVGLPKPDQAIERLNRRIDGFLTTDLVNSVFWDFRYCVSPEVGSGPGSRGEHLAAKRKWLEYALGAFQDATVTDVGCGDLEVTRTLPLRRYLGLDLSRQALALAARKRPDWFFVHLAGDEPAIAEADAVICLDVLIHQKSRAAFESLIRRLVCAARKRLIVSGFNTPQSTLGTLAYHRPIIDALNDTGEFSEIALLGTYRDVSLIVADKRRPAGHPHDMPAAEFNEAARLTGRPDLLRHLADLSRQMFSFYTAHFPRAIEYPWVAEKLENIAAGRRVVEIGAGLNPLPLFLARRGAGVDCIDAHPTKRTPPVRPDWNEWGFFDYSLLHPRLRSHNMSALDFVPESPVDVVYSVSVLEHMPRAAQRELIARCRQWLAKDGRLLLTIDLIPGTKSLWNLNEGKEVEPIGVHGTANDLLDDLGKHGFKPLQASIQTGVPHSRTDLLFVDCVAI